MATDEELVEPSDSFVFFGATGDLAKKKIYPALYRLAQRGELDVPIIGVASARRTLDELRAIARDSIVAAEGAVDDGAADELPRAAALRRRRLPRVVDVR